MSIQSGSYVRVQYGVPNARHIREGSVSHVDASRQQIVVVCAGTVLSVDLEKWTVTPRERYADADDRPLPLRSVTLLQEPEQGAAKGDTAAPGATEGPEQGPEPGPEPKVSEQKTEGSGKPADKFLVSLHADLTPPQNGGDNWKICVQLAYHDGSKHSLETTDVPDVDAPIAIPMFMRDTVDLFGQAGTAAMVRRLLKNLV